MTYLTMAIGDALRAAAVIVRQPDGWAQHQRKHLGSNGGHCALGALDRALGIGFVDSNFHVKTGFVEGERRDIVQALAAQLPVTLGPYTRQCGDGPAQRVADWNNWPGRTAEEVALAMEFAALMADEATKDVDDVVAAVS